MSAGLAPEQWDLLEDVPEPSETQALHGHGEAAASLLAAHRAGRLPHGLILGGPRGIGKATLAFHLARHLLAFPRCEEAPDTFAPIDPASALFRQVASGAHPSVLHLTRPFNERTKTFKTVLTVDEVRRVGHFLARTAHDGGYRVVIVDPADDMNVGAANALLKSLEEPPPRTVFMLVAHAPARLLPTLRSRSRLVRLAALDESALTRALAPLGAGQPEQALLHAAGGSVRQALLLMRHGGIEIAQSFLALMEKPAFDPLAALKLADSVTGKGRDAAFTLLREESLNLLTERAAQAAQARELVRADRMARAFGTIQEELQTASAFNLDRKQQTMALLREVYTALAA